MKKSRFVILTVALILIGTLTPISGQGLSAMSNITLRHIDKWIHLLMFLGLGFSIAQLEMSRALILLAYSLALILGWGTECFQEIIPGRGFDVYDLIADIIGAFLGLNLGHCFDKFRIFL